MKRAIYGKNGPKLGRTPALVLCNPKFPHNVGAFVRAASCFGAKQVWFSGNRVKLDAHKGYRLPREERMKGYKDVELLQFDHTFEQFEGVTPVAVELRPNAESLPQFTHPQNAVYIFGPEDGSIPQTVLAKCHRFVVIPTKHCVNLSSAGYIVLYDRLLKMDPQVTIQDMLNERRCWFSDDDQIQEDLGLT